MKLGFIIPTYDRIDDLLSHLDVLKFFPHPHEIIPIWMNKDMPDYFLKEMAKYKHSLYVDGVGFHIGPLLALVSGLRKASELGLDYIHYSNGDDVLFNHDFVWNNIMVLDKENKDVAAYNWLTTDTMMEFALNELCMRVDKFIRTAAEAEQYFRKSSSKFLCEFKMSRWIKRTTDRFYRLPNREISPGIGYELDTLPQIIAAMGIATTEQYWKDLENNNRWFNREWQMIGSHTNQQRYYYYCKIRNEIPYAAELEQQEHFARWLSVCRNGGEWNLPSSHIVKRNVEAERMMRLKRPLCMNRIPKRMPKRLLLGHG
jgi:hypothetical protein